MKFSEFDYKLLRKYHFTKNDISFILKYISEDDLSRLVRQLKKINSQQQMINEKNKIIERNEMIKKRNFEKQCKCNVGAVIISKMFELGIISSYEDIIVSGTNQLKEPVENFLRKACDDMENLG